MTVLPVALPGPSAERCRITWRVEHGDCIEALRALPERSIDAIVTDPPYGLEFMGKDWDRPWRSAPDFPAEAGPQMRAFQAWCTEWARECWRVLKPGGHALVFGGTRTYHRMAAGLEDGAFEIRDCIAWMYGSGFPKSLNVAKAIDQHRDDQVDRRATWRGWGTALKPAFEPIVVARKPLAGTVAGNVLAHGTGALNIDGCRLHPNGRRGSRPRLTGLGRNDDDGGQAEEQEYDEATGRWPPNVALDEAAAQCLDEMSGELTSGREAPGGHRRNADKFRTAYGNFAGSERERGVLYGDSGGASRFFYVAKASSAERDAGLYGFKEQTAAASGQASLFDSLRPA